MQEQEIHLRDYWKIIRKRKGIIVVFFMLTVIAVAIGTYTATPLYEAASEVLIEKSDTSELTGGSVYSRYDPEFNATQIQLIKSFNVAKRVVDSLNLATEYRDYFFQESFISNKKKEIISFFKVTLDNLLPGSDSGTGTLDHNLSTSKLLESNRLAITDSAIIAEMIMEEIKIKPVKESRVVQISFMQRNPVIAQLVANEIAKAYRDEVLEIKMSNSSYTIKWMSEKALEEREKLEESERKLQQYMAKANILTLEDKVAILPEKLRELSSRLSVAQASNNELEILSKKIDKIGDDFDQAETLTAITSSKFYQNILGKILEAEKVQKELSKKYGYKHPLMIQAVEQIDILRKEKQNEIKRQIRTISNQAEMARSEVKNIDKMFEATKIEAQKFNQNFIQYNILKRDVETNRTMYEALLSQVKEKKVGEETNSINVWITRAAIAPEYPAKPNKMRNLLLGVVLGLFGGIGMAFFVEYLDNTVRSPEELESRTGISVLSILERVGRGKVSDPAMNLLESEDGFSSYSESIKAIRTAILLSSADTPPKRILMTSSVPGEGKTTSVVHLAKSFALAQYKVLLIDADLRKPRLHKIFNIDNSKGLTPYLAGIENSEIVQQVGDGNLSIIPAGPMPPNPSELLVSDRFKFLLNSLEKEYDFIFIDSAPVFSATETLFLSKLAKPILIVRAGDTTYEHVAESVKMLNSSEASLLGLVLNSVDKKNAQYGYSSYKYYGYYTSTS